MLQLSMCSGKRSAPLNSQHHYRLVVRHSSEWTTFKFENICKMKMMTLNMKRNLLSRCIRYHHYLRLF